MALGQGRAAAVRAWSVGRGLAALLVLMLTTGCGSTGAVPVFPVEGVVQFAGEPAAGAFVVFHPLDGVLKDPTGAPVPLPTAKVNADGKFQLTTFDGGDGAPAGRYAVTVEWRKLVGKGNDMQAGPNVVPASYNDPAATPLQVTVEPKPTALEPFQITASKSSNRGRTARR